LDRLLPWLHLKNAPGIGNHLFKRLILRFGSPEAVLAAPAAELMAVDGMTPQRAAAVRSNRAQAQAAAEAAEARRHGLRLATFSDPDYPPLLREIPDPPPFLYAAGRLMRGMHPVAVVGSRNATPYGLDVAYRISAELAQLGFTVVSGMARGIDASAHEGALAGGGRTVAVLGSGLANIYPREHRALFGRIVAAGAVVSEFPPDAGPEAHHFPIRNRVISGMSYGTVVVEASRRSGALITARLAAEQNREVFAVPGSIQSFKSIGTHTLLKQGARLVENAQDIVDELGHFLQGAEEPCTTDAAAPAGMPPLTAEEETVLAALSPYPEHIDVVARRLNMEAGTLCGVLLQLELKGVVRQSAGKHFAAENTRGGSKPS
jgi:DNA processing protein